MARARVLFESVYMDVLFSLRSLRKRPFFTAVAVTTLGIGIGTTTAMFSVIDGVLLRELPYNEPGELVSVWRTLPSRRGRDLPNASWGDFLSYPEYEDLRNSSTVFEDVAIYGDGKMVLTGSGTPLELTVGNASASMTRVLGVPPALGRWFLPGEDGPTAEPLAVLSHGMWKDRFGADLLVLGKTVVLDDRPYTVVGVLPPGFKLRMLINRKVNDPDDRGIWVPTGSPGIQIDEWNHSYEGIARLAPGITVEQAQAETEAIVRGDADPSEVGVRLVPRKEAETGGVRSPLLILLGSTAILLLIACGNVATLLMGEAVGRRHEVATRAALGAGTWRISRQLLIESTLVGLLGAALGTLVALAGIRVLVALGPPIPRIADVAVNAGVLVFAAAAGTGAGILLGLSPAVYAVGNAQVLRARSTAGETSGSGRRFQIGVVSLEIALTVVLLVGGGLLIRSLANLIAVDPGFQTGSLAVAHVSVSEARYPTPAERAAVYRQMVERIEGVPAVERVSGTHRLPFFDRPSGNSIQLEGWEAERRAMARRTTVLPGFHEVMGIPLLAGRTFSSTDRAGAPGVMIVSEAMARRHWPNESALGARVRWSDRLWTVVGIVGDVKHVGLDSEVESTFYVPHAQTGYSEMTLVVSTAVDPPRVMPLLREAVWSVDPDLPVTLAGTMDSLVRESAANERYRTLLLTVFGAMAAVLAAVGVFGTTARAVAQRTREMGIRMALGARAGDLAKMVLRWSFSTGIMGTLLGLAAAFWTSRLLARFLFGIESRDPLTYAAVASLLLAVCLAASAVPARRATKVDPAQVLRAE